eukprot:5219856-Alexandrium_andersonii.AAC.1
MSVYNQSSLIFSTAFLCVVWFVCLFGVFACQALVSSRGGRAACEWPCDEGLAVAWWGVRIAVRLCRPGPTTRRRPNRTGIERNSGFCVQQNVQSVDC